MEKKINYWFLNDKKLLIAITEDSVYVGSIKKYIQSDIINSLEKGKVPNEIFSIPFTYIKSIENPEGKNKMTIFYGDDSSEEISIKNSKVKEAVFVSLKERLSKFRYINEKPSIIKHTKPQLFAILFVTGIFIWVFYLASQIEKGYEYEVVGAKKGISSLLLGLAQFGTIKVSIGFILLLLIAILSFVKRVKNRVPVEYLVRI